MPISPFSLVESERTLADVQLVVNAYRVVGCFSNPAMYCIMSVWLSLIDHLWYRGLAVEPTISCVYRCSRINLTNMRAPMHESSHN